MKRKLIYTLAAIALAAALPAEATTKWTLSGTKGTGQNSMTMTSDDDPALKITDVRLTASGETTLNIYGGKNFYDGCPEGSVDLDLTVPIYFGDDTTVQYSVAQLGNGTFSGNKQLRSVKLPSTLDSMEKENFKGCTSLKSVDMSLATGLKTIGPQVFSGCSSLEGYFYFPAAITNLANNMFNGTKIEGFCGAGVTTIENDAFQSCKSLMVVELPKIVTIGARAFQNCNALQSVRFGPNVTTFGQQAFQGDSAISVVFFEGNPPPSGNYFDQGGNQFIDFPKAGGVVFIPINDAKSGYTDAWATYSETWKTLTAGNTWTFPTLVDGVWQDGSFYNANNTKKTLKLRYWDPSEISSAALLAY